MSGDWISGQLEDICHVYQPETISQKSLQDGPYPVYGANGQIGWHAEFNHKEPELLLGCRGSCGFVHFSQPRAWINGNSMVVRPLNGKIDVNYLAYALRGGIDISAAITGAAQPQITRASLMPVAIRYPRDLSEQRRIVAILDETFAGIATVKANTEKNLRNAREVFEGYRRSAFHNRSWKVASLDSIATNLDSRRIPIAKSDRKAGSYPYYGASGIVDYVADYIFEGDALLVSEDGANLLARSTPIAFSVSGKYWVNNHAHILQFDDMQTQRFIEFYLESIPLDDYVTGAAQPKLTQKALNSIPIPLPPTSKEREKVVAKIEALQAETRHLESLATRKLAALDELKQSLLQRAFSGQL